MIRINKSEQKLYNFCKKIYFIIQSLRKNNIICLGIDPGVKIGVSIFSIENINDAQNLRTTYIHSYQNYYPKQIDFFNQDRRIKKIMNHIEDIILKYKVNIIALEQASYSVGKFSYSENLLARYTGAIYAVSILQNIKIIEIGYKLMQKLVASSCTLKKDKLVIKKYIEQIYPYEINLTQLDHLDALGYGYSIYLILRLYYKYNLHY